MAEIRVFTKNITAKSYDAGLANSIHFELTHDGTSQELNRGYGILFPQGKIREDNTIDPRGAQNPRILKLPENRQVNNYIIFCDYVNEASENIAEGKVYAWHTDDFTKFTEIGLISEDELKARADDCDGDSGNLEFTEKIEIDDSLVSGICQKWIPPYGISSRTLRKFEYPLVKGFADPVIFTWNGKWYFLATNDINGNIGIFMREADSVDNLFTENHKLSVILDYDEEKEFIQTFWAPEWHIIGGTPYILFAVGGKKWAPQSHMMKYKGTGDIMDPESWEEPIRVRKKDGSFLTEDGITLDMTYLKTPNKSYVIWSERYNIGTALDSGSMLYIGTIDEHNPSVLTSDKILLSRPLYGWENVAGTINNEGPYCLVRNNKVIVSYSGGDACGHYYAVGALSASVYDDLLDTSNWAKSQAPFFTAYTLDYIDGPGHSSFFTDENGEYMIAFHGQDNGRQSGIHPICFTDEGMPVVIDF